MIAQTDFDLNEDMIYLIETLKVEGYWSSKTFTLTLQNKDIPLLTHIEEIVKNLKLNFYKRILLKIRVDDNTKKEDISLNWKNKKVNFHIEKNAFNPIKLKVVTSLPFKKNYELKLKHKNKSYSIKIKVLKNKIKYESRLECWIYGDIRFPSRRILTFLDKHCKGNKNLHIENFLLKANDKIIMSAFSALIDCEGSIDYYDLHRRIRIRMRNKKFLKQWSQLLKKYNIGNKFRKNKNEWEVNITGWEDFNRLNQMGFRQYHSKKAKKWDSIMKSFKRNHVASKLVIKVFQVFFRNNSFS